MKKVELNKQQKRQRILQAAQGIFQECGFIGANMDNIAETAQVTKQTVYRYFKTKENLFKEALEDKRAASKNRFLEALEIEDSKEALQTFAKKFIKTHLSQEHLANIRLLVAEGPDVPEITRAFYTTGPQKTRSSLTRFIRDRFGIDEADYEITVFLSILLSWRMEVLTGLQGPPSSKAINKHAEKAVEVLLQILPR